MSIKPNNPRIYRCRCKSGLKGWRARLQANYKSLREWIHYARTYGLHERIGFKSMADAWYANPVIEGSVNPSDFRKVAA